MNNNRLAKAVRSTVALDIGAAVVVLADTSGSMDGKRIDRLREALTSIWPEMPKAQLIAFNDQVRLIADPNQLPYPMGGTDLAAGLQAAAELQPSKVIVISDGEPNDQVQALAAAEAIPGVIDVIFVGDEHNHEAIRFMRQLSAMGGGQTIVRDIGRSAKELLAPAMRSLLQIEGPIAL